MNKWTQWYDSLSPSTKEYLKGRAIWTDRDIFKAFAVGIIVGTFLGLAI
jgi:hypothetical protein